MAARQKLEIWELLDVDGFNFNGGKRFRVFFKLEQFSNDTSNDMTNRELTKKCD